jgi:aminocarboxymuconate-semialdehyde decarboxylase
MTPTSDQEGQVILKVIDLHSHLIPEECLNMEYRWGEHTYGIYTEGEGSDATVRLDGRMVLGPGVPGQRWMRESGIDPLWNPEVRLRDMKAMGVTTQVVAAPPFLYFYGVDPSLGLECSQRLNNGLARVCSEHGDSFIGLCTVPLQDVDKAVTELRRCINELGMAGVEINSNVNGKNLDDPDLFPFFEAVAELDVPIFLHPHTPSSAYGLNTDRFDKYYLRNLVGNPFETTLAVASLIFGRVLERLPELRIFCAHSGGNVAFNRGRWEFGWEEIKACQTIAKPPSAFLDSLFYDTIAHFEPALRYMHQTLGASQIVVGTDYPFDIGDWTPVATVNAAFDDEADRRLVLHENAQRIFASRSERN